MNPIIHRITLDLKFSKLRPVVNVRRLDTGHRLIATFVQDGKSYTITEGCTAKFSAITPEGKHLLRDCTIENNTVIYDFDGAESAVVGILECDIHLFKNGLKLSTSSFHIVVFPTAYADEGDKIVVSDGYKQLEELIEEVKQMKEDGPGGGGNVTIVPQHGIFVGANLRGMTVCFEQNPDCYGSGSGYEVIFKAGDDFEIFAEDDYYQVTIEGVTEGHNTGSFNAFSYTFPDDRDYIVSVYDEYVLKAMKFEDTKVSRAVGDEEGNNIRETYAKKNEIPSVPTKVSAFENDKKYLTNFTETDPTVPGHVKSITEQDIAKWNGKSDFSGKYSDLSGKPTIPSQASDVGAVPTTRKVNGKALSADITLSASDIGARPNTWTPSASDVGADKSGAASSAVSTHNTNTAAHNDIRLLIEGLTTRLNTLANSTDEDLDQMAELVAYIKANKTLIDSITTSKVSVADIANNLTSNVSNRPLSAAQGVALKALIDAIVVPTKLSDLSADASHRLVTDTEKAAWNAKSNFSGAYGDLTGKPTIPTVPTKVSAFTNDAGYLSAVPSGYAKAADHYTKTETDNKYQPKGNYLTSFTESDPTVPSWAKQPSKPSYTKSEVGLGNVDNAKQYSASNPPPYPVKSVNGKEGTVVLYLNDLGLSVELWTCELEGGTSATKKVVLAAADEPI